MQFITQQQEVAAQLRLDLTQSAQATLVQRWLNQSGEEIWNAADWNFTLDRQLVQTVADENAGTVSINTGTSAVTGVNTVFSVANDPGKFIQFSGSNEWYKISAVASTTSLTIEGTYNPTTNLSAGTYTIRQFFYSLAANTDRILDARQEVSPLFIQAVHYREFDMYRPLPIATGNPNIMILFGLDTSGNMKFTLYPWPSSALNIQVRFKKIYSNLVNNTDVSPIPTKWHEQLMIDGAIYRGLRYQSNGSADAEKRWIDAKLNFSNDLNKAIANQTFDASEHLVIDNRDISNTPLGPILPYKYGWE